MPRSQQPLFDILNQPARVQERADTSVQNTKVGSLLTQTEHSNSSSQAQNIIHTASQMSTLQNTIPSNSSPRNSVETDSSSSDQDIKPPDVTLRREQFCSTGRSDRLGSDSVYENSQAKDTISHNDICSPNAVAPSKELLNGNKLNQQEPVETKLITNGSSRKEKETKSDSSDSGLVSPSSDTISIEDEWNTKRHQHYPFRQALSEVILPSATQRRMSLVSVQERGYARLQEELMRAQKALERKDAEVDELRGIRERLMQEVSDFTAALFEEVNSQLNEAALSEQLAKKQLKEANIKIELLTAEVTALKDLVLTSTPSSPNKHLNPQIASTAKKDNKPFWKTHRRSTSHHQFTKESREMAEATEQHSLLKELDTVVFEEFKRWLLQPTTEFVGIFFARVQLEDIEPCLSFRNTRLANKLLESVKTNTLSIEPIPGDQSFPRRCCLSECHKLCNYKIKFEGDDEWYSISQMSRNRIASVCDFYAYLRYIVQGLVKCSDKDIFAELVRLRNQMAQARLGLI